MVFIFAAFRIGLCAQRHTQRYRSIETDTNYNSKSAWWFRFPRQTLCRWRLVSFLAPLYQVFYVSLLLCGTCYLGSFHANARSTDSLILLVLIRISNECRNKRRLFAQYLRKKYGERRGKEIKMVSNVYRAEFCIVAAERICEENAYKSNAILNDLMNCTLLQTYDRQTLLGPEWNFIIKTKQLQCVPKIAGNS